MLKDLQREARSTFLGKDGVMGVGEGSNQSPTLVFLLERDAPSPKRLIDSWAQSRGISVEYKIVGVPQAG